MLNFGFSGTLPVDGPSDKGVPTGEGSGVALMSAGDPALVVPPLGGSSRRFASSSCWRRKAVMTLPNPLMNSCNSGSASIFSVSLLLAAFGEAVPAQLT